MDFGKGIVNSNERKSSKGTKQKREYELLYKKNKWYIKYNGYLVEMEELPSLEGCTKMYALPTNEYYKEEWKESRTTEPISKERAKEISTLWSRYKPGDAVTIEFTKFKIK